MSVKFIFTKAELFEFCSANPGKSIISIHGQIYDITKFLDEHPGGEEVLKDFVIKDNKFIDATEVFEDVGHSMDARDLMDKFLVGNIKSSAHLFKQSSPIP